MNVGDLFGITYKMHTGKGMTVKTIALAPIVLYDWIKRQIAMIELAIPTTHHINPTVVATGPDLHNAWRKDTKGNDVKRRMIPQRRRENDGTPSERMEKEREALSGSKDNEEQWWRATFIEKLLQDVNAKQTKIWKN